MKAKLVTAMSVALGIVVLCWMASVKPTPPRSPWSAGT